MTDVFPGGWREGDTCYMIASKEKRTTLSFTVQSFDGRYFGIRGKTGMFHRVSPNRMFRSKEEAIASLEQLPANQELRADRGINQKYEIIDAPHQTYPFLRRIRALRDIGDKVKAGDVGGFVESERNLSFEPEDDSWIFDDAISTGAGRVEKGSRLFGNAVVCGCAYLTDGASMSAQARAEDDAYIQGADLCGHARASGKSRVLASPTARPILSENCAVYGTVQGDVHVMGATVIMSGETIRNETLDTLIINETGRSIVRDPSRDELKPCQPLQKEKKPRRRGMDRC